MEVQKICGDCAKWCNTVGESENLGECPKKKSVNRYALAPIEDKCFKKKNKDGK